MHQVPVDCRSRKKIPHTESDFAICGVGDNDLTIAMLAMTILVHFWAIHWATAPPTPPPSSQGPTCGTALQPTCNHLGHARLVRWWPQLLLAWRVLCLSGCALIAHKPAHAHGHVHIHTCPWRESRKLILARTKAQRAVIVRFGWALYAPRACYMVLWICILRVSRLAKCLLICLE